MAVKLYSKRLLEGNWGRLARMISFLVKHSSIAEGVETTRTGRCPNRRNKIGPYRLEILCRAWWRGFFKRWKWPNIGILGGLGGRFLV